MSDVDGERDSQRTKNTDRPDERPYRPRSGMSRRSSGFNNDPLVNDKRSLSRRIYRALARFFFAVLIGVGGTLAWQSYAEEANEGQDLGSIAGLVVTRFSDEVARTSRNFR